MSSTPPSNPEAPFVVIARVTAKTGTADELASYIANVKACSTTAEEQAKGCLEWRPARGIDGNFDHFVIFEKYQNMDAYGEHMKLAALQAFMGEAPRLIEDIDVKFYDEIAGAMMMG